MMAIRYNMIPVSSQIKSLRLKSSAAARATRIPKLPAKPCKAGTNVVVKAKVLQEVPEGKTHGQFETFCLLLK